VTSTDRIRIKRIYDPVETEDGARVLVDGMWPRGVSKAGAALHSWRPDVAPSAELRKWFGHQVERWDEFRRRYRDELEGNGGAGELAEVADASPLTLLYSARDTEHNQAVVLADLLRDHARDASSD